MIRRFYFTGAVVRVALIYFAGAVVRVALMSIGYLRDLTQYK